MAYFREISRPIEKRLSCARRKTRPFSTGSKPRTQIEPARRQHSFRPHDQERRQLPLSWNLSKKRGRTVVAGNEITHIAVRFWHLADIDAGAEHKTRDEVAVLGDYSERVSRNEIP